MTRSASLFLLLLPAALLALAAGCADTCTGVQCGPAPLPLEVIVTDTMTIDTTLYTLVEGNIDTLDTVMVVRRVTTDATVMLRSITGTDTTTFETLAPSENSYKRLTLDGLPGQPFVIAVERGGRRAFPVRAEVRKVEGCCPYSVVGRFEVAVL